MMLRIVANVITAEFRIRESGVKFALYTNPCRSYEQKDPRLLEEVRDLSL